MPTPAKCPGCGTRLQPDWESCPNCPLSFQEGSPEVGAMQSDTFRNIVMPILLFGGIGYGVWAMATFFWTSTEEGTRGAVTMAKKVASSAAAGSAAGDANKGGVVPVDSNAIQGLVNEQVTGVYDPKGHVKTVRKVNPDEEGGGVISIMPEASVKEKVVREWKIRGHVYDLVTLKPVAGAKLIFTDNETNSQAFLVSDAAGLYRIILPPLRGHGYLVAISKAGYAKTYLNPGTEGVSEMPIERRKELVSELSSTINEPASLEPNSETPLVTDFHLAPK